MTVREIAATDIVTADREETLAEVVERMADEKVGCVLVGDGDELVGIVTDRQIALSLGDHPDASDRTVGDVMTEDPVTVEPETGILEAIQRMDEASVRRLPVVEDDRIAGIVTLDDVLVALAEEFDTAVEVIEAQSPRF
jgi:CBS domain-containing protein